MRVRLQKRDGSFFETPELPEDVARELYGRYFSALHSSQGAMSDLTGVITVPGETYGLPGALYREQIAGPELVP